MVRDLACRQNLLIRRELATFVPTYELSRFRGIPLVGVAPSQQAVLLDAGMARASQRFARLD